SYVTVESVTVELLALVINYLLARPARADIIYTFTTTSPAPLAGPVSGSFVVPDSVILNNFITASEITSYNFILPSATSPFAPATFAPPDVLTIASPFNGAILVNPITGDFEADSRINITDSTTTQQLGLTTFPGTTPPLTPQYQVATGTAFFVQGSGVWRVQRTGAVVPEPSSILLVSTAGIFGLVYYGARRRSWAALVGHQ
ncbi:MAG: PEP-CTERM sorting domain-containing protein, partial [Planctomycetaceae bacterium]|nr:PEP-CTERM sorting domain-containing protein [Planctomycetaceae bacterium]